ncbi:MAG: carboxypeptidase-like regulatory domain-containing protein [Thermoguttaceae bacterium]|nr:carboxypeptidase-like regulatory domain-containing protein [Thermoguttaceae bacterium]MDW8079266.1 carboxypeptidase-like regulatory domain-containing protein [Thermoguttaceae bacterium]
MSSTRIWICVIGLSAYLAFVVLGCGGGSGRSTVTVTGQVLLDGSPVPGATVMFTGPQGASPVTATTDSSGNFRIEAVPGPNGVAVSKVEAGGGAGEAELAPAEGTEAAPRKSLLPEKYGNPKTSGITIEVKPGMAPVKIELKSSS